LTWIISEDFILRNTEKALGDYGIKRESKTLLDLDYTVDLSVLDKNVSKMNKRLRRLKKALRGLEA